MVFAALYLAGLATALGVACFAAGADAGTHNGWGWERGTWLVAIALCLAWPLVGLASPFFLLYEWGLRKGEER